MVNIKNDSQKILSKKTFFLSLLFFALLITSCGQDESEMNPDSNTGTNSNLTAPSFSLTSLDGKTVNLADFDKKVVVLFFFGNNCPTCKAAAPGIESSLFKPNEANPNFVLLGLDQWNGNKNSVEAFKTSTKVSFPLLLNASSVAAAYKTTFDRIVIIDKTGKIAYAGQQNASSDLNAAKNKVTELLSK